MRHGMLIAVVAGVMGCAVPCFALDTGSGVGGKANTATVSSSFNRSRETHGAQLGIPSIISAGRGVRTFTSGEKRTNPVPGGAYSAGSPMVSISGGKGPKGENTVPGRNDPQPNLGGRRHRDYSGGLGI